MIIAFSCSLVGNTAQPDMTESGTSFNFDINQKEIWQWNPNTAKAYYTNTWDGNNPTYRCKGEGEGSCQSVPKAPTAPPPLDDKVNPVASGEQCRFFWGGKLTRTGTYSQSVNINILSGSYKGNWWFTYRYNIIPTGSGDVTPYTAWELKPVSGG